MKIYQTKQIKNVALLGNAGSGKTTLSESMVFLGGVINRKGDIDSKNTVSDYRAIEHNNENSVFSTVMYTEINDKKIITRFIMLVIVSTVVFGFYGYYIDKTDINESIYYGELQCIQLQ